MVVVWVLVYCSGDGSESDGEDVLGGAGEVTLPQHLGRANLKSEQSTIRLSEVRLWVTEWAVYA